MIPLLIFSAVAMTLVGFRYVSQRREDQTVRIKTALTADIVAERLQRYLNERIQYLAAIRNGFESGHIHDRTEFKTHAEDAIRILSGFQAINWIDSNGIIQWVSPVKGNEPAIGKDLRAHEMAGPVLAEVDEMGIVEATKPIELLQGGWGFATYFPIRINGVNKGYINGVFRLAPMLDDALEDGIADEFWYSIRDGQGTVGETLPDSQHDRTPSLHGRADTIVQLANRDWHVALVPKPALIASFHSKFDDFIMVLGFILAAGLALVSDRFLKSRESLRSRTLELEAVYHAYPDLQFRVSSDGTILDYHTGDKSELYCRPEEFRGLRMQEVLPADVGKMFTEAMEKLKQGEPGAHFDYPLPLKAGIEFFEARILPVSADELVIITRNITRRKRIEESLRRLAVGVSSASDDTFFESVALHLAAAAGVDYAFVGLVDNSTGPIERIRTAAVCARGEIVENFEYELAGTPCRNIVDQNECVYSTGVRDLFPDDELLREKEVEAYVGVPLIDNQGETIGLLVLLHTAELPNVESISHMVRVFAVRCAAEYQRKRYEQQLKESEDRLRIVIENMPGIVYSYVKHDDNTRTSHYLSPGLSELIGSSENAERLWVEGDMFEEILHAADRKRLAETRAKLAKTLGNIDFEFRVRNDEGQYRWLRSLGRPVPVEDGIQWNGILLDIDQQKRVEEELERERRLFIGGPVVVMRWSASPGSPVEYASPNVEFMLGYSVEELKANSFQYESIIYPDDLDRMRSEVRTFLSEKRETFEQNYRVVHKNGSVRSLYVFTIINRNEEGEVTHFEGYILDITEHRQAQAALSRSERRYHKLIDSSPVPILVHDDNVILFANRAAANALGSTTPSDLVQREIWSILHPDDQQRVKERIRSMQESSTPSLPLIQERLIRLDGADIDVEVAASKIVFNDQLAVQVVFRNVTDRNRATRLATIQRKVLEAIAVGKPLPNILCELCRSIEQGLTNAFCSVMLIDDESGVLRLAAASTASSEVRKAYDRIEPGKAAGSCGTAAHSGETVIATDIQSDEHWSPELRKIAEMIGIRSCWSHPILSEQGRILGTFAISHCRPAEPDDFEQNVLQTAASLAGIAIMRDHAYEALRDSEERFRSVVTHAQPIVFAIDTDGVFTLSEGRSLSILGLKPGEVVGQSAFEMYRDYPTIIEGLRDALAGTVFRSTVNVDDIVFDYVVSPYVDSKDRVRGAIGMAIDITEQKRAEAALRESREHYRSLVEQAPEAIVVYDADTGHFIDVNENACELFRLDRHTLLNLSVRDVSPETQPGGKPSAELTHDYIERTLDGEALVFEWTHCDSTRHKIACEVRLVRMASAGRRLVRGSITDITERKEVERRQIFMIDELDHRVKNNLAAVLALTAQTVASSDSLDEFANVFTGRIEALARTHDVLAASKWKGVRIRDILRLILSPSLLKSSNNINYQGEHIILSARASGPVTMTLHELMTNSLKHGSLSVPTGRLNVDWYIDADRRLQVTWTESDGPRVEEPMHIGLGLKLIRGFIEHELAGKTTIRFDPQGLICQLSIPLTEQDRMDGPPTKQSATVTRQKERDR